MIESVIQVLFVGITYFILSYEFFEFGSKINNTHLSLKKHFIVFSIVYIWFVVTSLLELSLIVNWFVFLVILGVEMHIIFSFSYLKSYALSMFCTIMGLATNIFYRSLISIILNRPLTTFSHNLHFVKMIPITLGFISMIILFVWLRRHHFERRLRQLLDNNNSLRFYAWIEFFIYVFLIIQLFLYSQSSDLIGIKLMGIKASIFSIFVLLITIIYSFRLSSLYYYMDKKHKRQSVLIHEKEDINKYWELAYQDALTSCGNRYLLEKRFEEYAGYDGKMTLAFIDVNGLKNVNDRYGHIEGDRYLANATRVISKVIKDYNIDLFRYGGDEFIMLSNSIDEDVMIQLINEVNVLLSSMNNPLYDMSISFGVVFGNSVDYKTLIENADKKMYQFKKEHYEEMIRR